MLGWLWRLIVGRFRSCHHRWSVLDKNELKLPRTEAAVGWYSGPESGRWRVVGRIYTMQCAHCGNIKSVKVIA